MISFAGHLRLRAEARPDGRTVVAEQSFRAPFHLSKPYWDDEAGTLIAQVVNPTAGILAGDRLETDITVDTGAALLVTTPSANRVFAMTEGAAECRQRFRVASGACLEVSPEPLVPHRASRYRQATGVEVEHHGTLFYVDQLMPGRLGFGEAWSWTELTLDMTVRVAGELILRERFAHSGTELRDLATFAGSGTTASFANAVLITPDWESAPAWRAKLEALHNDVVWLGVSGLRNNRGWSIKIVAANPIALRDSVRKMREILASAVPQLGCVVRKL